MVEATLTKVAKNHPPSSPPPRPSSPIDPEEYGLGGGKKRKVPSSGLDHDRNPRDSNGGDQRPRKIRHIGSQAAQACSYRKAQYLRRRAALTILYVDAQTCLSKQKENQAAEKFRIPDVLSFEKLLPALVDFGATEWAMDNPGWRRGIEESSNRRTLGTWRRGFERRRRVRDARKPIVRGGWAPEGSFEFEKDCKSSAKARMFMNHRSTLLKLANEFRTIITTFPVSPEVLQEGQEEFTHGLKNEAVRLENDQLKLLQRTKELQAEHKKLTEQKQRLEEESIRLKMELERQRGKSQQPKPKEKESPQMDKSDSKASSDTPTVPGKKKPKKKKRSVLANQSNPHHVDNYRPSRVYTPPEDPFEPWPSHLNLLFPPSMRLLSARPVRKTAPLPGTTPDPGQGQGQTELSSRPKEDDYICSFCEYALYYGSEKLRRLAIRQRKAELKKREAIQIKAKNAAEGKGLKLHDDEDDEGSYVDENGVERCSCGRAIHTHDHGDDHNKPPDKDPPHSHDHHHHDHHHDHDHGHDHHHDHDHNHDHDHIHDLD